MHKNWKTTLVGIAGAAATILYPMVQAGEISGGDVKTALIIAAIGWFAKDAGVSGTVK